jgi:hypothetical protein
MTTFPLASEPGAEWRSAKLLHSLYTALAQEFVIELPPCSELESGEEDAPPESLEAAQAWLTRADERTPVHQLRQFLQTSNLATEQSLRAVLEHYLHKPERSTFDRDKIDFLFVQFFSVCAPAPLEDNEVSLEYVAAILSPVLGRVDLTLPESLQAVEELIQRANACGGLRELFSSGVLERGKKLKLSAGDDYFLPASLIAFARFNFLLRRIFFRMMHQELNAILDGLRELEQRGVETLDCRRAEFSADEPVVRLRMICQSWKVMFQAEYSSGQPLRMLVDLREVVDAALARSGQDSAGSPDSAMPLAKAASAFGEPDASDASASKQPGSEENSEAR